MILQKNLTLPEVITSSTGEAAVYLNRALIFTRDAGFDPETEAGAAIVASLVQASAIQSLMYVVASNTNGLESAIAEIAMVFEEAWR